MKQVLDFEVKCSACCDKKFDRDDLDPTGKVTDTCIENLRAFPVRDATRKDAMEHEADADEARRSAQHGSMKSRVVRDVNADIAGRAEHTNLAEAKAMDDVAGGILASPSAGGYTLALPILAAIIAYALLHLGINRLLRLIAHRQTTI